MLKLNQTFLGSSESINFDNFWFNELQMVSDLSPRLAILLEFRNNLPPKCFTYLVSNEKFIRWLRIYESQMKKWSVTGHPPDAETVIAFIGLTTGMTYEDVTNWVLKEAMSKPLQFKTDFEKNRQTFLRKQAVKKKVYRVRKSLEANGLFVRYQPRFPKEIANFIDKLRDL